MHTFTSDIVKDLPFYDKLTESDIQLIRQRAVVVVLPKGKRIKCYDKNGFGVFYILKGEVRFFLNNDGGKHITLFSLYREDVSILTATCILTPISFEAELSVECETSVYLIDIQCFRQILESNVQMQVYVYELLAESFSCVIENLKGVFLDSIDKRLAKFLLKKYLLHKQLQLNTTQAEIAMAISSSREVVGKALRKLTEEGIISCEVGKITVLDLEKLKRRGSFD